MTWLFVVVAILVVAAAFIASLGFLGELPEAEPDLRPGERDAQAQFDVVVRGYRMDEVDAELDRLRARLADAEDEAAAHRLSHADEDRSDPTPSS